MTRIASTVTAALLFLGVAVAMPASAAFTTDGTLDGSYGAPLSTQTTQTNFGNSTSGAVDNANGSELDLAYALFEGDNLYLFLSGNLESNFNKLEIFFDCAAGGQNQLRGDNPNVDFNGLNRMGNDGSGNGLKFDSGFEADYWIGMGGGGGPYQLYVNYSQILTSGGGSGGYLGQTGAASNGVLTGGSNPLGIKATINNSGIAGVDGGCAAGSGVGVTTGIELVIPKAALGGVKGPVKICAFVNGGGHDFVSNQVLGPLPVGTCNLGEPRTVDFGGLSGNQYFTVTNRVPAAGPWALALVSLGLLGSAVWVLRRRAVA